MIETVLLYLHQGDLKVVFAGLQEMRRPRQREEKREELGTPQTPVGRLRAESPRLCAPCTPTFNHPVFTLCSSLIIGYTHARHHLSLY
jgi:hypothetical protein